MTRAGRLWFGLAAALGALAHRSLLGFHAAQAPVPVDGDELFFGAHALSPWLVLPLALWLLWHRAPGYRALPDQRGLPGLGLLLVSLLAFAWAQLAQAADLLLISASVSLAGFAWWRKGWAGARQLGLPAAVLLIALPIPQPLQHAILWWLQLLTTWSSVTLLFLGGYDVYGSGTLIHLEDQYFQVIEACSGLRSLLILLLVSVVVRELFRYAGPRMWWVVASAPAVGFVANTLRVAIIALTAPEIEPGMPAEQDHTAQGLAVVIGGTAVLYALGRVLERRSPLPPPSSNGFDGPRARVTGVAWFALLALLSWLPPLEQPVPTPSTPLVLPTSLAGWEGELLSPDRLFLGSVPLSSIVEMRFVQTARPDAPPVYVFIGYRDFTRPRGSLLAAKLAVPGREWSPNGAELDRLWVLDQDVERVLAARPNEQAVSYVWHVDPPSLVSATLRSLLALPISAGARDDVVVRLTTSMVRVGPVARDQAEQRLDAFAKTFRKPLAAL